MYFDDRKPDLDDPGRALENARRYLGATEEMVRRDPNDRSSQRSHAIAMYRVSLTLRLFEPDAAVKLASDSVRFFDELIASGKDDLRTRSFRFSALERLARAQLGAGRFADARNSAESALSVGRSLAAGESAGRIVFRICPGAHTRWKGECRRRRIRTRRNPVA